MEWNFDFFTFEVAIKGKLQEMESFFLLSLETLKRINTTGDQVQL